MRRSVNEQRILETAEAFLTERPFHEVTVEEVMSQTGLTRTAFYRYFPDLDSVLIRLLTTATEEIVSSADWLADEPEIGLHAALESAAGRLAGIYAARGSLLRAGVEAAVFSDRIGAAWSTIMDRFAEINADRIAELVRRGDASVADPAEWARALVLMTEAYLRDATARAVPVERLTETLTELWHRAIVAAPPR